MSAGTVHDLGENALRAGDSHGPGQGDAPTFPHDSHNPACGRSSGTKLPVVQADSRFQLAVPDALALIGAVRDRDTQRSHSIIGKADLPAVAVVLAAMVDDNQSMRDLLRWTTYSVTLSPTCDPQLDRSPVGTRAVHGTRSRYTAGCRGEGCRQAESEYQRARHQRDKAKRMQEAS
jgi:hypothetical protein